MSERWERRRARAFAAMLAIGAVTGLWLGAAAAAGSPYIHAHRGGPIEEGAPVAGENTMTAFRRAAALGFVLELDVKLTQDGVPVVLHDPDLDFATDCDGPVAAFTAVALEACEVDILGTTGNNVQLDPGDPRRDHVPTLEELLEFARDAGAAINLEIKNVPTDGDFDPTSGFADAVVDELIASGFPPSRLIVQSFWPANLDVVKARMPDVETSFLTLAELNEGGPAFAKANGYDWFSPAWPISPALIAESHALGQQVVPYTLDTDEAIGAAFDAGVDAIISNDPGRARRVVSAREGAAPAIPPPPSAARCEEVRAADTAPPVTSADSSDPSAPRVFALQFKQELRNVVTYGDFRDKIECMVRDYVVPAMASGRPNVVALTEDVGLMTIATGSRGASARAIFGDPGNAPSCENEGAPCATLGALAAVTAEYAPQVAAYQARYAGSMLPVSSAFVAATDTFARGWMQVFSDMARRYGVYILGSNNQTPFRESRDPSEISLFADPDLPAPESVFVATRPAVYNEVFMWGPENVRREGPRPLRNVVAQNKKVPLTPIEEQIQLAAGPSTGPDAVENLRPFRIPGTGARIGFATSKPAFEYDDQTETSFGVPLAAGIDPCSDTAVYYMRCLDRLGTTVVMQDEANSGRWTGTSGEGHFTPLEWNRSTWRSSADPSVGFDYNVTPHMVGNLADLVFDGQTAITQRGLVGPGSGRPGLGAGCNYVGVTTFQPGDPENDPEHLRVYSGPKSEFVAIAPWVAPDGPRDGLRAAAAALAPGSGDPAENAYLETAIVADLAFPPNPRRSNCAASAADPKPGRCANTITGTPRADRLRGTAAGDRIFGLRGRDDIRAFRGDDCLWGQRGPDTLRGGKGADTLLASAGRDVLFGGPGRDVYVAGFGADLIFARDGFRDRINCGPGRDRAIVDRRDRVRGCERVLRRRP